MKKMNIMIFDVPAVEGGALTILNEFYSEISSNVTGDINWFFVVSKPKLEEKDNVKVLGYPWIKRSWFHRLYFDHFMAKKLIQKYNIDKVLSLQNIIIPHTKVPQILYVHQSLPFVEYKFKLNENILFWTYQNIIGKTIKKSIEQAEKVIVQTEWMKKACIEETGIDSKKIKVLSTKINIDIKDRFISDKESLKTFFFPADARSYKNHKIIIEACKILKEREIKDYEVILTLNRDENKHIINLNKEIINNLLPIKFIGRISREEVFKTYAKSILIFPSYIETVGLPLLESRLHEGIIFASNCLFSKEVLNGYENAYFFDPFDPIELSNLMEDMLRERIKYNKMEKLDVGHKDNGWIELLNDLINEED